MEQLKMLGEHDLTEKEALTAKVADAYRRDGYAVLVAPSGDALPSFLAGRRVDLIATRHDERTVVVVADGNETDAEAWSALSRVVAAEAGWHFRLLVVGTARRPRGPHAVWSPQEIAANVAKVRRLGANGDEEAALLLGWSAFEAAARAALVASGAALRATSSMGLAKGLVHLGLLSADDLDHLAPLDEKRDALAHGTRSVPIAAAELAQLAGVIESLLEPLPEATS